MKKSVKIPVQQLQIPLTHWQPFFIKLVTPESGLEGNGGSCLDRALSFSLSLLFLATVVPGMRNMFPLHQNTFSGAGRF